MPVLSARHLAFTLTALLFLLVFLVFTPHYQTPDDIFYQLVVSGRTVVTAPSEFLLVTNVLIGFVLKTLYSWLPSLPWYSLYLYTAYFLAHLLLFHTVLARSRSVLTCAFLFAFACIFSLPLLTQPQFSTASIFLGGVGLISLTVHILEAKRAFPWAAFGALIFASLIRFQGWQLIMVAAVPVACLLAARSRRDALAMARVLAPCVVACVVLHVFDRWYLRSAPGWEYYNSVLDQFVAIKDFDAVRNPSDGQLQKAGLTKNDFEMLLAWFWVDKDIFSSDTLSRLLSEAPSGVAEWHRDWWLAPLLYFRHWGWCGFLILSLSLGSWRLRLIPLLVVTTIVASFCILAVLGNPPWWRLCFPAMAFTSAMVLVIWAGDRPVKYPGLVGLAGLLCLYELGVTAVTLRKVDADMARKDGAIASALEKLAPQADQLFAVRAGDFPFQNYVLPFRESALRKDFNLYWMCYLSLTPLADAVLKERGITDFYDALISRPDILLISEPKGVSLLKTYYLERRERVVEATAIQANELLSVYRLR